MAIISYHVEAADLLTYTTRLLQAIQNQDLPQKNPHSNNISLLSGPQTLSITPCLLSKTSPMLKTILQESCIGYEEVSIILPSSFSTVLPSLQSLLYTGQASNMNRKQVDLLTLLTKELGMSTIFVTDTYHKFGQEKVIEGESYYSFNHTNIGGNVGYGHGLSLLGYSGEVHEVNDMVMSTNNIVTTGAKSKKVKFSEDVHYEDLQESDLLMCPPVQLNISMETNENSLKEMAICKPFSINEAEKVKVIAVLDEVVDEDVRDVFNSVSDVHVLDTFCGMANDVEGSTFFCNICDQVFGREYDFLDHLASTHYKSRLLNNFERYGNCCPICEKWTSDIGANMRHIGEAHEVVYEYYKADNFGEVGDIKYNEVKIHAKKSHKDLTENFKSKKEGGRTQIASTPPMKGILKLSRSNSKEAPKGILRTNHQKSTVPHQSILKLHKSPPSPKFNQMLVARSGQVESEDRGSRRVLLSIQDEVGEMMIDVE